MEGWRIYIFNALHVARMCGAMDFRSWETTQQKFAGCSILMCQRVFVHVCVFVRMC